MPRNHASLLQNRRNHNKRLPALHQQKGRQRPPGLARSLLANRPGLARSLLANRSRKSNRLGQVEPPEIESMQPAETSDQPGSKPATEETQS